MKFLLAMTWLLCATTVQAINPSRVYERTPDMYGLKYSQFQVKTADDYSINVWEYELEQNVKTKRTIIFVGPDAGNMSHMIWQAKFFLAKGLRVVSFDYRGFGKSQDFDIRNDFLFHHEFALDLDSVIRAVRNKYPAENIGLYSLSMGSYISLIRKERIEFLIVEGFYNDPQSVIERIKTSKSKTVLLPKKTKKVEKLRPRVPALIFCSTEDVITTRHDASHFAKKNQVVLTPFEGGHLTGFHTMTKTDPGDEYLGSIISFLDDNAL